MLSRSSFDLWSGQGTSWAHPPVSQVDTHTASCLDIITGADVGHRTHSKQRSDNCTHVTASISFSLASQGLPSGFRKSACVRLHSESSEPTMFSQTAPDEHPPMPPPCRWPAVTTSPTLAKFQLVWRRFCDVVVFPSCLEHTLTALCTTPLVSAP